MFVRISSACVRLCSVYGPGVEAVVAKDVSVNAMKRAHGVFTLPSRLSFGIEHTSHTHRSPNVHIRRARQPIALSLSSSTACLPPSLGTACQPHLYVYVVFVYARIQYACEQESTKKGVALPSRHAMRGLFLCDISLTAFAQPEFLSVCSVYVLYAYARTDAPSHGHLAT